MDVDNIDLPRTGLGVGQNNTDDQPMPDADANTSRSNRPGQKGFAQRLMSKYGWTAGSGLGADNSGIINPLQVKLEKRRKRPDAEGGGYADPANRARIIGGKTAATAATGGSSGTSGSATPAEANAGKFGPMSEVIVLQNMLENMPSLQEEIEDGLGQEIGEECGDKYGRVERLHIDVAGRQVFIKFTDQVSALRAVNALEGRVFNGNSIAARFWDTEKFEKGEYV
jgi:splicing factor 45